MLKAKLFFLYSITIVAIASFVLCIFNYNPFGANTAVFVYFFLSLIVSIFGIMTLVIFYVQVSMKRSEQIYSLFWPSARQALLFSIAITSILFLKSLKILDLWTGVPILIVIMLLELFFQNKKAKSA